MNDKVLWWMKSFSSPRGSLVLPPLCSLLCLPCCPPGLHRHPLQAHSSGSVRNPASAAGMGLTLRLTSFLCKAFCYKGTRLLFWESFMKIAFCICSRPSLSYDLKVKSVEGWDEVHLCCREWRLWPWIWLISGILPWRGVPVFRLFNFSGKSFL